MKVLIVEPGYSPYEADIENTPASLTAVLESEQYTAAFPFDNTVIAAVYGGDAEKPYNRTLGSIGLVQGRFIVCGSCALPGFVDSKNEEKTERNAGYLVVSHSGGGMLRQGTRKGIRRTPANRGMRAHRIVKSLDISEDVCHGLCP